MLYFLSKKVRHFTILLWLSLFFNTNAGAQKSSKVLFLGNSYTFYNNMPQMVADMATNTGDTLNWSMLAPGGAYLYDHLNSQTSLNQIMEGDWDYVAMQEQSQALTLPDYQIGLTLTSIYELDSTINFYNPCVETMYYLTWGRKNGDKLFYRIYSGYTDSTYEYMDSLLLARYTHVADSNQGEIAPAGAVWRYLRENHPGLELYQADESHPSIIGSYAAACAFYTAIFRKDPANLTFNASLNAGDAQIVRNAAREVVYKNLLDWNIGKFDSLKAPSCQKIGVAEPNPTSKWTVYPNPATTEITINVGDESKNKTISIYNAKGQLMEELEVKGQATLNISDWAKGIYFLQNDKSIKLLKQ